MNNGNSRVASYQRPTASSHWRLTRSMSQAPQSHDDYSMLNLKIQLMKLLTWRVHLHHFLFHLFKHLGDVLIYVKMMWQLLAQLNNPLYNCQWKLATKKPIKMKLSSLGE